MDDASSQVSVVAHPDWATPATRREFLNRIRGGAAVALASSAVPFGVSAQADQWRSAGGESSSGQGGVEPPAGVKNRRVIEAFDLRVAEAIQDASVPAAINLNNGDEARYADKGGTYTKALPHDSYGRVNLNAYQSLKTALNSGEFADFQNIIMGGSRTLNGPLGGLCFCLEAVDNVQFGQPQVPPAPAVASDQNGTELLEHYWTSLLRDVAFTDYPSNSLAVQAAAELGSQPTYFGPRDTHGQLTPNLLFRGGFRGSFPGETLGPYISQFLLLRTFFGSQPIDQQQVTYLPNFDYMTDFADWLAIQNGANTSEPKKPA